MYLLLFMYLYIIIDLFLFVKIFHFSMFLIYSLLYDLAFLILLLPHSHDISVKIFPSNHVLLFQRYWLKVD